MKNMGLRLSDQRHTHTVADAISRLGYDPSVNQPAESYFETKSTRTQKTVLEKLDCSLKYNGAN